MKLKENGPITSRDIKSHRGAVHTHSKFMKDTVGLIDEAQPAKGQSVSRVSGGVRRDGGREMRALRGDGVREVRGDGG